MSGILRVEKNGNYTVLHRAALNDKRLSWKAKGILAYMLSMPNDWIFYMEELMKHATDGEKSFRAGFNELKKHGYVKRFPVYENKKIIRWETVVFESPYRQGENLLAQNVQVGKVDVQKEALLSTDSLLSIDKKEYVVQEQDDRVAIPYEAIISYLNQQAGTSYKYTTKKTQQLIKARFQEGFTQQDFETVIDKKVLTWLHDAKMMNYLRPETLFGTKFESYFNENTVARHSAAPRSAPSPIELNFNEGEEF